ncbi:D-alanyl-D-alanine carboxypeptidase [Streptomyces solincola]|uniref:D-alanyl-D-alanine carboxypeptidase n=1 Tax=Streptomyces solincola TaxID=2100817 RepID=A0A2S9PST5_9ACTN|nr:serine hydrolase domain-containing protein [Streptomyces solincola]PRH77464.1 D-alanyl-D-alanine carboxypeptidase [Streptomyces solincola]
MFASGWTRPGRRRGTTRVAVAAMGLALVVSCGSPTRGTGAPEPAATSKSPVYEQLARTVRGTMDAGLIPGAVVMVDSPEWGRWSQSFGTQTYQGTSPVSVADHFRVGSNTKTMTSTVILQLVQEGRLKLSDPISRFEPDVPNGGNITIANLSEMRSGLPSYSVDKGFNRALDEDPQRVWKPRELLDIAFRQPQVSAPGKQFYYSNTNIILLGLVVERLTGKPLSQVFKERIFTPLGMSSTLLPGPRDASIPENHPQGYQYGDNEQTLNSYALPAGQLQKAREGTLKPLDETSANPSWAWAAGGAISTTQDLSVYVKKLVAGGLLDATTQRVRLDSIRPTDPGDPAAAGYGLGIASFGPLIGHDGQIPGFMTFMGHDPGKRLTVVIMTNLSAVPANGEGSALQILKAMMPTLYPGVSVPKDPARR